MSIERPADEIQAGDVIDYANDGRMLVTIPGEPEQDKWTGRTVGHHGVILTLPTGDTGDVFRVGRVMSTLHKPREAVTVHERRKFAAGDPCPCDHHRKARSYTGEPGEFTAPPVETEPLTWPLMKPDHKAAYGRTWHGVMPKAWNDQLADVARGRVHTLDGKWQGSDRRGWTGKPRSARALGALLALGLIREVPGGVSAPTFGGEGFARLVVLTPLALHRFESYGVTLPAAAVKAAKEHATEADPGYADMVKGRSPLAGSDEARAASAPVDPEPEPVKVREMWEPGHGPDDVQEDDGAPELGTVDDKPGNVPLAVAVRAAGKLGAGWSAAEYTSGREVGAEIVHTDGRRLRVLPKDDAGTCLRVSVWYPTEDECGTRIYDGWRPETTFRADRPGGDLAEQIRRRILPTYDEHFPVMIAARDQHRRSEALDEGYAQRLAAYVPGGRVTRTEPSPWIVARPREGGMRSSLSQSHVQVLSDSVILEFKWVDKETAEALMRVYGAHIKARIARGE